MLSVIVGIGGIEIADRQLLGVLGHGEAQLGDEILVRHPDGGREREDLQPLGRQIAVLAQAQRHLVQVRVVARRAIDLEPEEASAADHLARVRREAGKRLPATVLGRIGAQRARRDLAAGRKLPLVRRGHGGSAIGALAAVEPKARLDVRPRPVQMIVIAAAIGIEDPEEQRVLHALGDAQEDGLAVVWIAFRGRGPRPVGHRQRRFLGHGIRGSEQGRHREHP